MVGRCHYKHDGRLYEDYYRTQVGHGLPVFIGGKSMRGLRLGYLLGGLFRSVVLLLKSGGKALLKEGAKSGMQLAQDVLFGQSLKTAAKRKAQEAGKRLFHQAVGKVTGAAAPTENRPGNV